MSQNSPLILHTHIPKTGGSTFCHSVLPNAFGTDSIFAFGPDEIEAKLNELAAKSPEDLNKLDVVTGHFTYGLHHRLSKETTYVTFLRDPVDVFLSNYYYILTRPFHPEHKEFLEKMHTPEEYLGIDMPNRQAYWLTENNTEQSKEMLDQAKQNLTEKFSVAAITERFDESICLFEQVFGISPIVFETRNTTPIRPSQSAIPRSLKEKIQEVNWIDVELYSFACQYFDEQLSRYSKQTIAQSLIYKADSAVSEGNVERAFSLIERAWTLCPDNEELKKLRLFSLEQVINLMASKRAL